MYCKQCGKDIGDSKYCPECGARQEPFAPVDLHTPAYPTSGYPMDTGSWGWFVLSFIIPPIGFILWLAWMGVKPRCSAKCGWGCLAGVIFWPFIFPMLFVAMIMALPTTETSVLLLGLL